MSTESVRAKLGIGVTPNESLGADLNKTGTTQPVVPQGATGLDALHAKLGIGGGGAPVTPKAPVAPATESPSLWSRYSTGAQRALAVTDAGIVAGAGQLLRSFQWTADRLVGDRAEQKASDVVQNSEIQASSDMFKIYKHYKDIGDTANADRIFKKLQVMDKSTSPYKAYADTTDSFAYKAQDKTQAWADALKTNAGVTPENQTFAEKVLEGAGSSLVYYVPGIGVARGASILAKVSPAIATIFGGSASAALEAMSEAGSTFDTVKKTDGLQKAGEESTKVFLANAILLAVTNHLGIFNTSKLSLLKKALLSAPVEGSQEAVQQMIQNNATGKPIWDGVLEAGTIGAIIGSVLGGTTDLLMEPGATENGAGLPSTTIPPARASLHSKLGVTDQPVTTPDTRTALEQQKAIEQATQTETVTPTATVPQETTHITPETQPTESPKINPTDLFPKSETPVVEKPPVTEMKISKEQQAKATEDWANNYADQVTVLDREYNDIITQIKEAKGVEREKLQTQKLDVQERLVKLEQEYLQKWQPKAEAVTSQSLWTNKLGLESDNGTADVQTGDAVTFNGKHWTVGTILEMSKGDTKYELIPESASTPAQKQAIEEKKNPTPDGEPVVTSKTPATPELAAEEYWDKVIKPASQKDEPIVIGADDLKDYFGNDYNDANHPIYSRAAFLLYERALAETTPQDEVVLTGGGAGSGKTEILVKEMKAAGFTGIIYDSNMANLEGVKKQIKMAEDADRTVRIYGITPNLESARTFTIQRENKIGRGISDATFARGHAGFPNVIAQLLTEKVISPKNVFLLDTRGQVSLEQAKEMVRNGTFVKNPLAYVKKLGYTEDYVKQTYSKDGFSQTTGQRLQGGEIPQKPRVTPDKSGTNKTTLSLEVQNAPTEKESKTQTEVAGKKVNRFSGQPQESATPRVQGKLKPLVTKTGLKALLNNTPDFKANPVLKVEEQTVTFTHGNNEPNKTMKVLAWSNGKTSFAIKPSALGLVEDNLKVGDAVQVSVESLSRSGNEFRVIKYDEQGKGTSYASVGKYRENTPLKPTEIKVGDTVKITQKVRKPNEPAFRVGIVRKVDLKDSVNKIGQTLPAGIVADMNEPYLFGNKTSFKDNVITPHTLTAEEQKQVDSTIAENISAKEFMVQQMRQSGNHASIGTYRDGTEVISNNPDNLKPLQFPELVGLAKELSGNVPFLRKYKKANGMFYPKGDGEIGLNPELFKRENLSQLQATLAHEIGHLVDYLPDKTMTRGNLLGRLNTLKGFRTDFYHEAGTTRTDKQLREEMYQLSKYWRPFEEESVPASYLAYRKSAPEVYADFISALFNDPRTVSEIAPTAYNLFFEQLDRKPAVKTAYFDLQTLLRTGDLTASRRSATTDMFKLTEQQSKERQIQEQIKQEEKERSVWFKFKTEMVDIAEVVREDVKKAMKAGAYVNPDDNPTYYLEERNYLGGHIKAEVDTKFNTIYQELQKNGLTWEDLGELMFYERVAKGDRQEIANPLGYQPDFVQELMEVYDDVGKVEPNAEAHRKATSDMRTTMGDEKYGKLQSLAVQYRENLKGIFQEGFAEGIYSDELNQLFNENAYYVPFKGAKYSGVSRTTFGVKQQKGTLDNIENPANTGIEKAVSIIRAIERNKVTRKTVEFYKANFPEEVTEATLDKNGYPLEPKDKSLGLVTYMEGGKVKGYHVDAYIAEAIKKTPVANMNVMVEGLRFFNSNLFRPLFITFNLGFQTFNLIRDMKRFWKNVPNMTVLQTMRLYSQSMRASKIRAFGLPANPSVADQEAYDLINKLENEKVISITYNDIIKGESLEDAQIERILREVGVREVKDTKLGLLGQKVGLTKNSPILKQAFALMDFIEKTGNMIETLPKVAGVKAIEGTMAPIEMRSFVRKYVGSPDFLAGGRDKKSMNEVFLFANAIFQGVRSDYEIATAPKSRGAYWMKTMQSEIIPKMLMALAAAGLFGDYLKELLGKISEYDKTNYTTIPFGEDQNGKTVYFRLPSDETGRLISGIFWKMASAVSDPKKLAEFGTYTDMVSYAGGQVPGVTPVATAGFNLMQFLGGANPYDFFRQQPLLTDEQQLAGGMERVKPFASYMFQQLGGGIFMKLYTNETVPKNPSLSEKIASFPLIGNVAGRFLKASNYGEVEKVREVTNEVRSQKASENIANRRVVFNYVDQAKDMSPAEVQAFKKKMIQEIYGGVPKTPSDRTQARNLEKRFDTLRLRGKADAKLDALITAQSNEEKVVLLGEYQKSMSDTEFADLKKFIIKNKVVSPAVFQEFNRVNK